MSQHVVVVGRGLAGAMVAWKFAERGCRISWWGDGESGASRVAAGMFNPVSFRRVVEVWNASAHVANMRSTLQAMEEAFGMQGALVHNVPVVKVFANDAYRQTWDDRWATDHGVTQWAERGQPAEDLGITSLNAPHGVGKVHAAGWVNVPALLDAMETHVASHHTLVDRAWRVEDGLPDGADAVVDCRGVGAAKELSEVGLKVNPNHGDVLTLSTEADALQTQGHNVNNGKWLLPMRQQDGRQWWRLGATYSWDKPTSAPHGPAAQSLKDHMADAFHGGASQAWDKGRVEAHQAGLRPASPDRRPMVGPWPGQPEGVLMLNGLGTRGVLVGPAAAEALVNFWLDDAPISPEMRPDRFKSVRARFPD